MAAVNDPEPPAPTLRPTRPCTLVLFGLFGGVVGRWTLEAWYGELPPLSWGPALTVSVVAICEAVTAWRLRPRILRTRSNARPVEPLFVARLAVLAKASGALGALVTGLFGGALLWLWPQRDAVVAVAADIAPAVGSVVAGALLLAAALWLEYTCRIPRPESPKEPTDGVSSADMG